MKLQDLQFQNSLVESFPKDPDPSNKSRITPGVIYTATNPTPVRKPEILIWSDSAGELLDLPPPDKKDGEEAQIFGGNKILPSMSTYATRYGGHQFGVWAGQLGDGRAIALGEVINSKNQRIEIQLKGAGQTPYSRFADGRAVLRSSLREFLCSEALFYLSIPTTRALCCCLTNEEVVRDMFYNGNPKPEPGAITTRLAPSFIRFGHFEILTANGEFKLLKDLADYVIKLHYPEFQNLKEDKYAHWFAEVSRKTAHLMVEWFRVGFIHGVMNTDNMSILGLTIDYGPYGWLDIYDPSWTPNTSDAQNKRYAFGNQANIGFWNLQKLAEALEPLRNSENDFHVGLKLYQEVFEKEIIKSLSAKLGFHEVTKEDNQELLISLDQALQSTEIDYCIFYQKLSQVLATSEKEKLSSEAILNLIKDCFYAKEEIKLDSCPLVDWVKSFLTKHIEDKNPLEQKLLQMKKHNPYFILRNYLVQQALDKLAGGDRTYLDSLMLALQTPYEENKFTKPFFQKRPEWARNQPGSASLSCSS